MKEQKLKCLKCNYNWLPRIPNPKECPACKSRHWNESEAWLFKNPVALAAVRRGLADAAQGRVSKVGKNRQQKKQEGKK